MAKNSHLAQKTTDVILKIIWACTVIGIFILAIIKVLNQEFLQATRFEYLLLALLAFFVIPYLGKLEAFGIKVEIRKVIEDLDARVKAIPDYIMGSEYYNEGDLQLAEQCFNYSLNKDAHFWPAKLNLGSIAQDREKFDEAIMWYKSILKEDTREGDDTKDIYAHNNLSDVYLYAEEPYRDPTQALFHAMQTIELSPGLGSAHMHKVEALNRLNRCSEAIPLVKLILEKHIVPKQEHWAKYELMLSQSNLGNDVDSKELKEIYRIAMSNGEGQYFLEMLKKERVLFPPKIHKMIDDFLSAPSFS